MAIKERSPTRRALGNRLPLVLDIYGRVLAVLMMLFGLLQWAVISAWSPAPAARSRR